MAFTEWEISLTKDGTMSQIIKDGVDISNEIMSISIHAAPRELTTVTVEYRAAAVGGKVQTEQEG